MNNKLSTSNLSLSIILWILTFSFSLQFISHAEEMQPAVLYETGSSSAVPLTEESLAQKTGWVKIEKPSTIKTDVVLVSSGIAVVVRKQGNALEIYGNNGQKWVHRSNIVPVGEEWKIEGAKSLQHDATSASAEITFSGKSGKGVLIVSVDTGKPVLKTKPVSGIEGLKWICETQLAVLPDFFADDLVIDARSIPVQKTEIPSEHIFMELLGEGDAIVMAVWDKSLRDVSIELEGDQQSRKIKNVEIYYDGGAIWMAVLEQKGIWAVEEITPENVQKQITLKWEVPFRAKWKGNFMRVDHTVDSWEFIINPARRTMWSGVAGNYEYPCWIVDNQKEKAKGMIQPPTKFPNGNFAGPFVVYPVDRTSETPLQQMTVTDVMRACLGVGPCEYIMDVAGQGVTNKGIYTCSVEHTVPLLFEFGLAKEERVYLNAMLREVQVFVKAIQDRINSYVDFREQTLKYLAEQKIAHPEQADFISKLEEQTKGIQSTRANGIEPVSKMVAQLKPEIWADIHKVDIRGVCSGIAGVGLGQDNAVARCRQKVKVLRQMATIEMAINPKNSSVAKEIRKRTQEILRNPYGHEMR